MFQVVKPVNRHVIIVRPGFRLQPGKWNRRGVHASPEKINLHQVDLAG